MKVVPRASRRGAGGVVGDRLKVRVQEPPEDGRANEALVEVLADALGVSRRSIHILSGHASPEKQVRIEGLAPERLEDIG
ncbi:MAG: DUF167 domain-containing protein [Phycisphaeraceae bacterium]|nr:DUF167 domain-containing protein [Phycisphaeraceae bacterium]